ncbi:MAG: GW dipeptide domain-containing protein [Lactobacillus sp.]|nr:GW dipeptide domain-containing protein [Lactobacillus sp.]
MKIKSMLCASLIATLAFSGYNVQRAQAKQTNYRKVMTKMPGTKTFGIYKTISGNKPKGKITNTSYFKYSHIETSTKRTTKNGTYWYIAINGRNVGWVNQNWFQRNKISAVKKISLVRDWTDGGGHNYTDKFKTLDAVNWVTDSTGTVLDNSKITASDSTLTASTPGTKTVTLTCGKAKASIQVTVRENPTEGSASLLSISKFGKGSSKANPPKTHFGSSPNYKNSITNKPETINQKFSLQSNAFNISFTTKFYQPVRFSFDSDEGGNKINNVGHINEGMTMHDKWLFVSLLGKESDMQGHVVGYNLSKMNRTYAQRLRSMPMKKFQQYCKNIKVSPLVLTGHGQAMGSSSKYVYLIANNHKTASSNEPIRLVQLNRSNMEMNSITTFRIAAGSKNRYIHNAYIGSDNKLYAIFRNGGSKNYEFWSVTKQSNGEWVPKQDAGMTGQFVKNGSPVQGFAYDIPNGNYYVAFNDYIFRVDSKGKLVATYGSMGFGREIEGIAVNNGRLYVNLAQRAQLVESNPLK